MEGAHAVKIASKGTTQGFWKCAPGLVNLNARVGASWPVHAAAMGVRGSARRNLDRCKFWLFESKSENIRRVFWAAAGVAPARDGMQPECQLSHSEWWWVAMQHAVHRRIYARVAMPVRSRGTTLLVY